MSVARDVQAGGHRMADPAVRRRALAVAAALFAISSFVASVAGKPGGPYGRAELADLSGVPVAPPQIERRTPPAGAPIDDLVRQLEQLGRDLNGKG